MFQRDFPISERPYLEIAKQTGNSEQEILNTFAELSNKAYISRIGPVITPNRIGVSTLAAMEVPLDNFEQTIAIINSFSEVNHNYEREHRLNIWFVVIALNKNRLLEIIKDIEQQSGIAVLQFPLIEDYFIDLGFQLNLDGDINGN